MRSGMDLPTRWDEPPWGAPLDPAAVIAAVPADATMSGLFLAAVADFASSAGHRLERARERYVPFRRYPLREHCELLVEACTRVMPRDPLRIALRRLGRGAPRTLVGSIVGRVVLGSVEGPLEILRAMVKSYPLHMSPGTLEVVPLAPGRAVVRMRSIHHFLDSHNVGVMEGVLRYAEVEGTVRIHAYSERDADLLCEWSAR